MEEEETTVERLLGKHVSHTRTGSRIPYCGRLRACVYVVVLGRARHSGRRSLSVSASVSLIPDTLQRAIVAVDTTTISAMVLLGSESESERTHDS